MPTRLRPVEENVSTSECVKREQRRSSSGRSRRALERDCVTCRLAPSLSQQRAAVLPYRLTHRFVLCMARSSTTRTPEILADSLPPAAWFTQLRQRLAAWYGEQARELPWRGSRDPYAIWVSEIMLQQTTVATVRPRFAAFLTAFPTIAALAAAKEEAVLRQWEGLGYYRRARQLHAAAQRIVAEHGGKFPREFEAIRALPGIGRYTAGAIASIAFDQRAPILEANTLRVWARLLAEPRPLASAAAQERLWQAAEMILPKENLRVPLARPVSGKRGRSEATDQVSDDEDNTTGLASGTKSSDLVSSGTINQALMDLGSGVCLPRGPLCLLCPVNSLCTARQLGTPEKFPTAAEKTNWTLRHEAAVLVRDKQQRILVVQYAEKQRWAGMWDLPRLTVSIGEAIPTTAKLDGEAFRVDLQLKFQNLLGAAVKLGEPQHRLRHGVTRYKITLDLFAAKFAKPPATLTKLGPALQAVRWVTPTELHELPLSTTGRALVKKFCSS
jgi:A/G-specific adenine glycosylase